ncbi:MAG: hypothetical protein ACKOGA_22330 [Planctomycetaceae bacterium]
MSAQSQSALLPPGFLLRYTLPVQPAPILSGSATSGVVLGADHQLPSLSEITGEPNWMSLAAGWNHSGLGFAAIVKLPPTKSRPRPTTPPLQYPFLWRLMFDLRDTRNIHRANRFCFHFTLHVERGGNWENRELRQLWIDRAREPAPLVELSLIKHRVQDFADGYRVELWFPSATLPGFDPGEYRRIGFNYDFEDEKCGRQSLCLHPGFPTIYDPSLWQSLELAGDGATEESSPKASPRTKGTSRTDQTISSKKS